MRRLAEEADGELRALFGRLRRLLPGLEGRLGAPLPGELDLDRPQPLRALLEHWRQAHPEAGRHYWAARVWTLLIWQPVYLQVLARRLGAGVPQLAGLGQSVQRGVVAGFSLPAHRPLDGQPAERLERAGEELRRFCRQQYAQCAPLLGLHPEMARRLTADCLLAALLHSRALDGLTPRDTHQQADAWLRACALDGASGLLDVPRADGERALALDRRVCCQHFRRADGQPCDDCPRRSRAERLARLRGEPG